MINEGLDVTHLKEHDSVFIKNPTSEDFSWKFNGEIYSLKKGDAKAFSKFVAFHLAKHLSTKMVVDSVHLTAKQLENRNDPIHAKLSQLAVYDTHERRIALFKIFENSDLVVSCVSMYPFKGFLGDMQEYKDFVDGYGKKKSSESNDNQARSEVTPK